VAMQEDHNFPDCFLLNPGSENPGSANWSDAVDFTQPVRCRLGRESSSGYSRPLSAYSV
jgi:hypothetical protein